MGAEGAACHEVFAALSRGCWVDRSEAVAMPTIGLPDQLMRQ